MRNNHPQAIDPDLTDRRQRAVQLRLSGQTLAQVAEHTNLSAPTIKSLVQAYETGGWSAVADRSVGRPKGGSKLGQRQLMELKSKLLSEHTRQVLNTEGLARWIAESSQSTADERAAIRRLADWQLLPPDTPNQAGHFYPTPHTAVLWARGPKSEIYLQICPLPLTDSDYLQMFQRMLDQHPNGFSLTFSEEDFPGIRYTPKLSEFLASHPAVTFTILSQPHHFSNTSPAMHTSTQEQPDSISVSGSNLTTLTHLQRLEAESIAIMREVVAEADNPVMLYSIGKDSAVMLRLAVKAFYPAKIPFPLLHVDTTWKFQDMYRFRAQMQQEHDFKLLVHTNQEGLKQGINPFTHGSQIHTDIMKTVALKQALDQYGFDVAFGGARRDEEKSRAKERVFSFRTKDHRWDPKNQRPELWSLYNTKKHKGESIRVFPISNWTELDIWQYIYLENIPIVPLYFSAPRPVVNRDGTLIMVDDDRMPLAPGEVPMMKSVRFRTLGCYPLTGAVESKADTLEQIIQEMLLTKTSERQGRMIDHDAAASMEKKKQEGYF